jgi:RHS repeat-associated protein
VNANDGSGGGSWGAYDPWGNATNPPPASFPAWNYYRWNGAWGYLTFDDLGLYYVHGRWYNPDTGRFISPDEKGEYLYGSGNDAINEMWVQFIGGAAYQAAKNNVDTLSLVPSIFPSYRENYARLTTAFESNYVPNTLPARFGQVFGSTLTLAQGLAEINVAPTIAGGGTIFSCLTAGPETLGIGCVVGGGASVGAGGVVLVHGLAVSGVSLVNGAQQTMSLMSGKGLGNIGGGYISSDKVLDAAEKWLGKGYKEIAPGVYRSADGTRQFRMTDGDLLDPRQGAHVHFESIAPDGRQIIENAHVVIRD